MNGVFITGSNTDVGKTTVGVEIIRHLSKTRKVRVRKPVETNCQLINKVYAPKDAIALNEACLEPEPLGVPKNRVDQRRKLTATRRNGLTTLDKWLLSQIEKRLVNIPLRIQLWDQSTMSDNVPTVRIHDRGALIRLIFNPELEFGDLYSSGRIEFFGNFDELIESAYNYVKDTTTFARLIRRLRKLAAPDLAQSRRNIHHHYDIGNDFYKLWLDEKAMQYTCAYYPNDSMDLETAQQEKMHHVCRKLWLKPNDTVVEAGCGWGGFALFMAQHYGVKVRAFNISHEQILHAREWAKQKNLSDRVEFVEDDYRNVVGQYDVFVSIGMLEHVGRANYQELGKIIKRSLKQTGRGLVHSIGRDKKIPFNPSDFKIYRKYEKVDELD